MWRATVHSYKIQIPTPFGKKQFKGSQVAQASRLCTQQFRQVFNEVETCR